MALHLKIVFLSEDRSASRNALRAQSVEVAEDDRRFLIPLEDGGAVEGLIVESSGRECIEIDVASVDLRSAKLQNLIFSLAQSPAIVASDDAELAAVVREDDKSAALMYWPGDPEDIDVCGSASEIFESLFGVEPPAPNNPDLFAQLLELGFDQDDGPDELHKELASGLSATIACYEHEVWGTARGFYCQVCDPHFAAVMARWSPNMASPLGELALTHRKNTKGALFWAGGVDFTSFPATRQTRLLGVPHSPLTLEKFVSSLDAPQLDLAGECFVGDLGNYLMPTDGLWVFLFCSARAGHSSEETMAWYRNLTSQGATFHTTQRLNERIVAAYSAFFLSGRVG